MKTLFLLFVVLTDPEGYESMQRVSDVQYKTKLECIAAKAHYKDVENRIQFFCGEEHLYFNKQQNFGNRKGTCESFSSGEFLPHPPPVKGSS